MEPRRPPLRTRAAAWVVTGPVGHAYGGAVDWALLAARWSWGRRSRARPSRR